MPANVTLREIAQRAGVSVATVSMALRESRLISAPTRRRVVALAEKMGYRRHPYVAALMSWRRQGRRPRKPSIAVLHHYAKPNGWRLHVSASLREMRRGVWTQLRAQGFDAEEFWMGAASPRRLVDILRARGIRGLIFAPLPVQIDYEFPWAEFSAVQIGRGPVGLKLPRVSPDHYHSALEAVRRCLTRGYRRPGLVIDRAHDGRMQHVWRAGFEMGLAERGASRARVLLLADAEARPDPNTFRQWIERHRPDVIVTNLHELVESQLGSLGRSVPAEVGLVSLSVPQLGSRLSGIEQNGFLVGAQAVDLVAGALHLNRAGLLDEAMVTLVAGRWNEGETF